MNEKQNKKKMRRLSKDNLKTAKRLLKYIDRKSTRLNSSHWS